MQSDWLLQYPFTYKHRYVVSTGDKWKERLKFITMTTAKQNSTKNSLCHLKEHEVIRNNTVVLEFSCSRNISALKLSVTQNKSTVRTSAGPDFREQTAQRQNVRRRFGVNSAHSDDSFLSRRGRPDMCTGWQKDQRLTNHKALRMWRRWRWQAESPSRPVKDSERGGSADRGSGIKEKEIGSHRPPPPPPPPAGGEQSAAAATFSLKS